MRESHLQMEELCVNRLREHRLRLGYTLREVSFLLGIPLSTIQKHEVGTIELDGLAIDRYRRLYGVRAVELWLTPEEIEEREASCRTLATA